MLEVDLSMANDGTSSQAAKFETILLYIAGTGNGLEHVGAYVTLAVSRVKVLK